MSYVSSNFAPQLMVGLPGRGHSTGMLNYGGNTWHYLSADAIGTVVGSSYFSDGWARGMRKYDYVNVIDTGTTAVSVAVVTSFSSASGGCTVTSVQTT